MCFLYRQDFMFHMTIGLEVIGRDIHKLNYVSLFPAVLCDKTMSDFRFISCYLAPFLLANTSSG